MTEPPTRYAEEILKAAETLRWVSRGTKPVALESGFLLEDDGKVERIETSRFFAP